MITDMNDEYKEDDHDDHDHDKMATKKTMVTWAYDDGHKERRSR